MKLYPSDDREAIKQTILKLLDKKIIIYEDSNELIKALLSILNTSDLGVNIEILIKEQLDQLSSALVKNWPNPNII